MKNVLTISCLSFASVFLIACSSSTQSAEDTDLHIEDFYGEWVFNEVAYVEQSSSVSDEQYQDDVKAISDLFSGAEFTIGESYFYETSGTFGENPSEGFEFIRAEEYESRLYDDAAIENSENVQELSSLFDYEEIKEALDVNDIEHYLMYTDGGVLSNPLFYVTENDIFVANESISFGETEDSIKGYTHYLLRLEKE
ncbi:hypothetical protein FLK61_23240 [Paenalkalicoccus suaedae]|uniref:Lipocalin-like domain-containing protein n=1 Tax=Paenalkalicoccus suaedae TaxID=2592382 RepID=A0A859FBV5_9BACI|nr:hypothetical protein [Paenalkalicoccus suaedae]QKS69716.1 hypothetical protein FLK61_23240 [Paenalkalicoccus suaedae]